MDRLTPEKRSALMRKVKGKNTAPELVVRRLLHRLGYRFRLHGKGLPGKPDIVFSARRKIVLVHGCFWHGHDCKYGRFPKSRPDFWVPKIEKNRLRDAKNLDLLRVAGWDVFIVWQCEIRNAAELLVRLTRFLGAPKTGASKVAIR